MPTNPTQQASAELIDLTEPMQDVRILAQVKRKWYNPMRYLSGTYHPRKCIVQILPQQNDSK